MGPRDAAAAFVKAVRDRNEPAAMAACTRDGWIGPGESGLALYEQAVEGGFDLKPGEKVHQEGSRAAIGVAVQEGGEDIDLVWLLLEENLGNWRIGGYSALEPVPGLFLEGKLPARNDWMGLPESPEARAWAEQLIGWIQGQEIPEGVHPATRALVPRLQPILREGDEIVVKRTIDLTTIGRRAVGIAFTRPDPVQDEPRLIVLAQEGEDWFPYHVRRNPDVPALLYGLTWKGAHEADPAPELTRAQQEAQRKTQEALEKVLRRAGVPVASDGTPDTDRISAEELERRAPEIARAAAEEVLEDVKGAELRLDGLPEPVRNALHGYLKEHTDAEQVRLEPEFLREHGPAIVQQVLSEVGKQIASQSMEVELSQGDGGKKVQISLGDLFKALTRPKSSPGPAQGEGEDEDEDEDEA